MDEWFGDTVKSYQPEFEYASWTAVSEQDRTELLNSLPVRVDCTVPSQWCPVHQTATPQAHIPGTDRYGCWHCVR